MTQEARSAATKSERVKVAAERLREIAAVVRSTMGDDDTELGWSQALEEVADYLVETGK